MNEMMDVYDVMQIKKEMEAFSKWQLEVEDIIQTIMKTLGWQLIIKEDQTGKVTIELIPLFEKKYGKKPLINEKGIIMVLESLFKIINKNTFLANLSDKEVKTILFDHMISIMDDLAMNFDYYGIESIASLGIIRSTIENMCEIALTRGRGGTTLDYLKTIQKFKEIITGKGLEKKEGMF